MELGEFGSQQRVLDQRQNAVGDVAPARHAALERVAAEDPRPQHAGIQPRPDHRRHGRDQLGRVLIVGMHHDHDVRGFVEREPVRGLLVRAVAAVARVDLEPRVRQRARDGNRLVLAAVVDDHDQVHDALRHHLVVRPAQRARGVVRGHDDDDLLTLKHAWRSASGRRSVPESMARS